MLNRRYFEYPLKKYLGTNHCIQTSDINNVHGQIMTGTILLLMIILNMEAQNFHPYTGE